LVVAGEGLLNFTASSNFISQNIFSQNDQNLYRKILKLKVLRIYKMKEMESKIYFN